jgi:hypothetical protein
VRHAAGARGSQRQAGEGWKPSVDRSSEKDGVD